MTRFIMRAACVDDCIALSAIDRYLPEDEYRRKLETHPEQVLLLLEGDEIIGVLRWSLFWDYIPYTCYLNVSGKCRGKGYAKKALEYWENKMREEGWPMVMCSIPFDDAARHFYLKMGYEECGSLNITKGPLKQPSEIFFSKVFENGPNTKLGSIYR